MQDVATITLGTCFIIEVKACGLAALNMPCLCWPALCQAY